MLKVVKSVEKNEKGIKDDSSEGKLREEKSNKNSEKAQLGEHSSRWVSIKETSSNNLMHTTTNRKPQVPSPPEPPKDCKISDQILSSNT